MNFDKYFDCKYDEKNYNCAHFVCDIWKDIFNQDISNALNGFLCEPQKRKANAHNLAVFERLSAPQGICMALFQIQRRQPHVGMWFAGKVLHITEKGVEWVHTETLLVSFNKVRFYNVKKSNNL